MNTTVNMYSNTTTTPRNHSTTTNSRNNSYRGGGNSTFVIEEPLPPHLQPPAPRRQLQTTTEFQQTMPNLPNISSASTTNISLNFSNHNNTNTTLPAGLFNPENSSGAQNNVNIPSFLKFTPRGFNTAGFAQFIQPGLEVDVNAAVEVMDKEEVVMADESEEWRNGIEKKKLLMKQIAQWDKKAKEAKDEYSSVAQAEDERYYQLQLKITKSKNKSERAKAVMRDWETAEDIQQKKVEELELEDQRKMDLMTRLGVHILYDSELYKSSKKTVYTGVTLTNVSPSAPLAEFSIHFKGLEFSNQWKFEELQSVVPKFSQFSKLSKFVKEQKITDAVIVILKCRQYWMEQIKSKVENPSSSLSSSVSMSTTETSNLLNVSDDLFADEL